MAINVTDPDQLAIDILKLLELHNENVTSFAMQWRRGKPLLLQVDYEHPGKKVGELKEGL